MVKEEVSIRVIAHLLTPRPFNQCVMKIIIIINVSGVDKCAGTLNKLLRWLYTM